MTTLPTKVEELTQEQYEQLKRDFYEYERDSKILDALHAGGVNNWEYYGDAMNTLDEETYYGDDL